MKLMRLRRKLPFEAWSLVMTSFLMLACRLCAISLGREVSSRFYLLYLRSRFER